MEACKLVEGQRYSKKLNDKQVTNILRATCQHHQQREQNIREILLDNFMSGCLHKLLEYFQPHECPAPLQQYGRTLLLRLKRSTPFTGDESTSGALQQLPARQRHADQSIEQQLNSGDDPNIGMCTSRLNSNQALKKSPLNSEGRRTEATTYNMKISTDKWMHSNPSDPNIERHPIRFVTTGLLCLCLCLWCVFSGWNHHQKIQSSGCYPRKRSTSPSSGTKLPAYDLLICCLLCDYKDSHVVSMHGDSALSVSL